MDDNTLLLWRAVAALMPATVPHMIETERDALLKYMATITEQRNKAEGRLSVVQSLHLESSDLVAKARDVLLQVAIHIQDEAATATDDELVTVQLPGRLARPLCLMGQEVTLAATVRELSNKVGRRNLLGFAYGAVVVAHSYSTTGKSLAVEDTVTRKRFTVPCSQIVEEESKVVEPGDRGMLVVTDWYAEKAGWKTL
jgi:hypothetical protein